MNDFGRNCRTLIICFVIALVALVPLRFIEVGNQESTLYGGRNQVLGDEIDAYYNGGEDYEVEEEMIEEDEGIVLPDSDIHYLIEERIY